MFKFFMDLKIGIKLVVGFSVMILLIVFNGLTGFLGISAVNSEVSEMSSVRLPSLDFLIEADRDLQQLLVAERSMMFSDARSEVFKNFMAEYEENYQQSDERWNKFRALAASDEEKAILPQYEAARKAWEEVSRQIINARQSDSEEGIQRAIELSLTTGKEKFEVMRDCLNQLQEINLQMADEARQAAESRYKKSTGASVLYTLAGLFIGLLMMWVINRSVTVPVKGVVNMLEDIAEGEGDLTKRIDVKSKDEVGELAHWFNLFIDKLYGLIDQIKKNTDQVATASNEISSTSSQMAAGIQEQSSQAAEVAASVQQMSAAVLENSQNAAHTAEIAGRANGMAQEGAVAMQATKEGMAGIVASAESTKEIIQSLSSRADQIGQIIETINDIADQTNLLALNAAIEAARAGEQGRGFAVVADEVRKLAERTTRATQEVAETIGAIQNDTRDAVLSMEEAGKAVSTGQVATERTEAVLTGIVREVTQAMEMIQQIATASEEQSSATELISTNVESISTVTKQSASGAEELATTAVHLSRLSEELRQMVGMFKL